MAAAFSYDRIKHFESGIDKIRFAAQFNGGDDNLDGGVNADNLSMISIRWEDNYAEDTLGSVSTKTMPIDSFTTQMEAFAKARKVTQPLPNLSDEDIERAIQEINAAIRKFSK